MKMTRLIIGRENGTEEIDLDFSCLESTRICCPLDIRTHLSCRITLIRNKLMIECHLFFIRHSCILINLSIFPLYDIPLRQREEVAIFIWCIDFLILLIDPWSDAIIDMIWSEFFPCICF